MIACEKKVEFGRTFSKEIIHGTKMRIRKGLDGIKRYVRLGTKKFGFCNYELKKN